MITTLNDALKSRLLVLAAIGLLTCLFSAWAKAIPAEFSDYTRVFYDPFDNTDFSDNWRDFRTPGTTAGQGSGVYASEAVTEKNGNLRIEAYSALNSNGVQKNYVGSVRTHRAFTYGYFEATIKFEGASGLHQAFWMLPDTAKISTQPPNAFLNGAELDIVEHRILDMNERDISKATSHGDHYAGYGSNQVSTQRLIGNTLDNVDTFHRYGMLWDKDQYKFYIDDKYVGFTINDNQEGTAISGVAEYLLLSNNVGVAWSGPVAESYGDLGTVGSRMIVGSVSAYQLVPEPTSLVCIGFALMACVRPTRRSSLAV